MINDHRIIKRARDWANVRTFFDIGKSYENESRSRSVRATTTEKTTMKAAEATDRRMVAAEKSFSSIC